MKNRSIRFLDLCSALTAALVLSTATAPAAATPVYVVRELLPRSGDVSAQATALNAKGEVVGFSVNGFGIPSALKWRGDRMEVLFQATEGVNPIGAKAFDINDLGLTVGVVLGYEEHFPSPPPYSVGGTGPIVWGAGDFRVPRCTLDDGAIKISNAGVVLNWADCVYSVDQADAAFLETGRAAGQRLFENGLVLDKEGTIGQALWGPLEDSYWDRRFWARTDLSTCGIPASEDTPWDDYICELASKGYERSRTLNAKGQYIVNSGSRAYLYTPVSEPASLATAGLLLAILIVVRRTLPTMAERMPI